MYMKTYDYDSDYLALLADRWTRASFPLISRLVRTTLEARLPRQILDFGAGAGVLPGDATRNQRGLRIGDDNVRQRLLRHP